MSNIITELTQAIQSVYPHRDAIPLSINSLPPSPDTLYPSVSTIVGSKLNSLYFRDRDKAEGGPSNDEALYTAHRQLFKNIRRKPA